MPVPAPDYIKPFQASRPSGPIFIGLNILRLLSVVALLLAIASNILTMVDDIKAVKANNASSADAVDYDCEYVEYSTVPEQTGGAFWSILNRLFIIFECILLAMSEIGVPKRLFNDFIPVLGAEHGLGCLGVLQALVGASVLSHYCDLFPQVAAWLLFILGCLNMAAGVIFRSAGKTKRLIFSWENAASLTPQTRVAYSAWDFVSEKRAAARAPTAGSPKAGSAAGSTDRVEPPRPGTSHSDTPLLPENTTAPGERFGGFGFGRQADKAAAARGWNISKPLDSLPSEPRVPWPSSLAADCNLGGKS